MGDVTHTISAPVSPILIVVARAIHSRPQSRLPLEPVLQPVPSLYIAPSRKPQKPASRISTPFRALVGGNGNGLHLSHCTHLDLLS